MSKRPIECYGHPTGCSCDDCVECITRSESDPINRPAHYITPSGLESVDVLEAFNLNMHRGTAVAYILRAGRKGGPEQELQDLQKAHRWLGREINRLQGKREW